MSIGPLITEGVGSFGDVAHVVRDGLDAGITAIATIITEAFGTLTDRSAFLVTEGFGDGGVTPVVATREPTLFAANVGRMMDR